MFSLFGKSLTNDKVLRTNDLYIERDLKVGNAIYNNEGVHISTTGSNNNTSSEIFHIESNNRSNGFRWVCDGENDKYSLFRHNDSTVGNEVLYVKKNEDTVHFNGLVSSLGVSNVGDLYVDGDVIATGKLISNSGVSTIGSIFASSDILSLDSIGAGLDFYASGIIHMLDGNFNNPIYTFTFDKDTGMYRSSNGVIGFSCNTNIALLIGQGGITTSLDLTTGNLRTDCVSSPCFEFNSDTKIYLEGTDQIGFSCGGITGAIMSQNILDLAGKVRFNEIGGIFVNDTRNDNLGPNEYDQVVRYDFKLNSSINSPPVGGSYCGLTTFIPWVDGSGGSGFQVAHGNGGMAFRQNSINGTTWSNPWKSIAINDMLFDFNFGADVYVPNGFISIGTTSNVAPLNIETNGAESESIILSNSGTGDPAIRFSTTITDWIIGVDNNDSDVFRISRSTNLGVTKIITISEGGNMTVRGDADTLLTIQTSANDLNNEPRLIIADQLGVWKLQMMVDLDDDMAKFLSAAGYQFDNHMGTDGSKGFVFGGLNSDTIDTIPDAQLVLDGAYNAGYNLSTKLLIRGFDDETDTKPISCVSESGLEVFAVRSNKYAYGAVDVLGELNIGTASTIRNGISCSHSAGTEFEINFKRGTNTYPHAQIISYGSLSGRNENLGFWMGSGSSAPLLKLQLIQGTTGAVGMEMNSAIDMNNNYLTNASSITCSNLIQTQYINVTNGITTPNWASSDFETLETTLVFTGPWSGNLTVNVNLTRMKNVVTITFENIKKTFNSANDIDSTSALPQRFRPPSYTYFFALGLDGFLASYYSFGWIDSNGFIVIRKNLSTSNWTGADGPGDSGVCAFGASYLI